jgi:hypothetical protein
VSANDLERFSALADNFNICFSDVASSDATISCLGFAHENLRKDERWHKTQKEPCDEVLPKFSDSPFFGYCTIFGGLLAHCDISKDRLDDTLLFAWFPRQCSRGLCGPSSLHHNTTLLKVIYRLLFSIVFPLRRQLEDNARFISNNINLVRPEAVEVVCQRYSDFMSTSRKKLGNHNVLPLK